MKDENKELEDSKKDSEEKSEEESEEKSKDESKEKEESEKKSEDSKDEFEKEKELVSAGKYNQAVRKQRELELEKKELEKKIAEKPEEPAEEESEEEDDEVSSLVDEKVKPIMERLNQKEASEKKLQRSAFFDKYPKYLNDSEKWQELLDELDNSLNPSSQDSYYEQLVKAHKIISDGTEEGIIEDKKRELANEAGTDGDGAEKQQEEAADERADRMAKQMPPGFEYKE